MTSRPTKEFGMKNAQSPCLSAMFRFKGHDSYCYSLYNSSFVGGGSPLMNGTLQEGGYYG